MIANGIAGSALVVVAAFAAGIAFARLSRSKRSFWHLIGQPAARIFRANVISVGAGLIFVSVSWRNSAVTWALDGVVVALVVAEAGVELRAWLRHHRSLESRA